MLNKIPANENIILAVTPVISYLAKNAQINPLPYLFCEFVAANTWSTALIVGNPTNIYLATSRGIGFVDYFEVMALPTLLAGVVAFVLLYLIFYR